MKLNHPILHPLSARLVASTFAVALATLCSNVAKATPYASSLTNNGAGTMSFYLNESGGNVTITYEDGSTNATYNGITTGTNLILGAHTFSVVGHTNYTISVFKSGSGVPTLITNFNQGGFTNLLGNVRGVDVNRHPASTNFGLVYMAESRIPTLGLNSAGIWIFNPDLTTNTATAQTAGVNWGNNGNGSGFAPYRVSVSDDDYLMVGIAATNNSGVFRIPPTLATNQLILGPVAYGIVSNSYGSTWSRPLLTGNIQTGATLWRVDCDLPTTYNGVNGGYNSILVDTNITLASLPRQTPPDIVGPNLEFPTLPAQLLFNEYPGLQIPGNGLIYASISRDNYAAPSVTIYTNDPANGFPRVWSSQYGATSDYFTTTQNGITRGVIDIAVSPDLKYMTGLTINNWFVICPLTNGLPDVANIFYSTPTSYTGNGRGTAFDAADNLYLSSSGLGYMESWSLGVTTTAVTTGNTNGSTGFSLTLPATTASVVATQNFASQGGTNGVPGTPITGVFTITRTNANNDYSSPVTLNFTLGGTATNGVYTVSPANVVPATNNTLVLPPGVTSTNITIIPTTNNVPRLQTTVVLSLHGGASYSVVQPASDTVYIQNTSTNQLVLTTNAPSMYNAFSNDFGSATITRLGDTNAPAYNVTSFTYTGTAVAGTDFAPVPTMTFNPGDITNTAFIFPLSNGVPPIHTTNSVYSGNKTVTVTLGSGTAFATNSLNYSTTLTIIDNADPPGGLLLFSDPLTSAPDAANWGINYGSLNLNADAANYDVEFGYDLTTDPTGNNGIIPLPPGGATNALRITCNKHNLTQTYPGGVSVYYTNQAFSGNFAVRFNMNVLAGFSANNVEGVMFGINHNGLETNWFSQTGITVTPGPWAADGVFYWIQTPPGGTGGVAVPNDYIEFTGAGSVATNTGWVQEGTGAATPFRNIFKHSIFTAPGAITGGTPANNSPVSPSPADNTWSDVEIKQVNSVVTMSIDKTVLFTFTNTIPTTSLSTNGFLMLGYDCPFGGVLGSYLDTPDAAAYFANLRVVELAPYIISQPVSLIATQGANVSFASTATYGTAPLTNVWYLGNTTPVVALQTNTANATSFTDSLLLNNVQSGTNYFAVFSDTAGSVASSVAQLEVIAGPANATANAGANATFSVSASGQSAPTAFRWMTNGVPLTNGTHYAGVTTSTLTITNVQQADAITYSVAVTNAAGSVKPSAALTVNPAAPTSVVVTPASQTKLWGSTATFTVTASGTQPFTYQWKKAGSDLSNGGNVSGATNNVLTLSPVTGADAASYTAGVTNTVGGAVSSAGALSIFVPPPKFTATSLAGTNVVMSFTSTNAFDTTNAFILLSSPVVTGPYTTNASATFTISNGTFRVTSPQTNNTEFYRLQHVN